MKKIFAILILTFAFTTGMAVVAPPAAQARGLIKLFAHAMKDAAEEAKAAKTGAKVAEATATGVKFENKGVEATATATVASAEVNGLKVENTGVKIAPGGGGGDEIAPSRGGGDAPMVWFFVLCVVGVGGLLVFNFRGKRA
jgi:hypothetical protein